jgi:hypothetical protein
MIARGHEKGHEKVVQMLLDQGANVNAQGGGNDMPSMQHQ